MISSHIHRQRISGALSSFAGLLAAALIAVSALSAAPARAETLWISDNLTVPLRSGPSTGHRILHRGLPSGTRLEVLSRDEASSFVQVRTDREMEGWLPEQYLVSEPIARDQLVAAQARVRELTSTLESLRSQLSSVNADKSATEQSNSELRAELASTQAELSEIRRISTGAIEQNETNRELRALNDRLRAEVDELVITIAALEDNVQQRWLLIGGGLVLGGLVLGISIKARPRRSAWS
ncbi:MAG: TIGR04211 family SH3 domain-containing protein [Pseudomonadales bacterium]|nr:TIGR04211 family SH3 domain-containing protein [Pseudomonadales bacterium]